MYPRLRIDITWSDLAKAMGYCVAAGATKPLPLRTTVPGDAIVTLSVRSGFDLLLASLSLPAGSEVLLSEVTVPHMPRIVREHGLVPVAVPVDPRTLGVNVEDVRRQLSPRTKVVVVAHLFGSRMPLAELGELCRARGILLVEDCAQALTSGAPERDPAADASLYSFGPIKTATALGGGIAMVRDAALRARMVAQAGSWPRQSTLGYAARVAKIAALKALSQRWLFTPLVASIEAVGGDADAFVGHSARGFPDDRLFACLRQRPSAALQQLIAWRLANFDKRCIAERTRRGQRLAAAIESPMFVAGCDNATHTYWVFPLVCEKPANVVRPLRGAGFDASQISGLTVVGDGDFNGDLDRCPDRRRDHWLSRTVFVPCGPQVPERKLNRAAEIICRQASDEVAGTSRLGEVE